MSLSRSILERALANDIEELKKNIAELLKEGGEEKQLHAVELVGGGSRVPFIRDAVAEATGKLAKNEMRIEKEKQKEKT